MLPSLIVGILNNKDYLERSCKTLFCVLCWTTCVNAEHWSEHEGEHTRILLAIITKNIILLI